MTRGTPGCGGCDAREGHPGHPPGGRFLTRDPIKDGRNWYAYCGNNPLKHVDPDGQMPQWIGDAWDKIKQIPGKIKGWIDGVTPGIIQWWKDVKKWPAIAVAAIMATIAEVARHVSDIKREPGAPTPPFKPDPFFPNPANPTGPPVLPRYDPDIPNQEHHANYENTKKWLEPEPEP